jgi:hypothetical protein
MAVCTSVNKRACHLASTSVGGEDALDGFLLKSMMSVAC